MAYYNSEQIKLELFKTILANPSNSFDKLKIDDVLKAVEKMADTVQSLNVSKN